MKKAIISVIMVIAFLCCSTLFGMAQEQESDLRLLFTSDIHSNIEPSYNVNDNVNTKTGGFSRLKTAVDRYRKDNTLLLDSGDFTMGTLYQIFFKTNPLELKFLNEIGYDAMAVGNHDFDLGDAAFHQSLSSFRASGGTLDILCSNIKGKDQKEKGLDENILEDLDVKNYEIIEKNGYRVGVFSLMGKGASAYIVSDEFAFEDPVKMAKAYAKLLREQEKADVVVMLSHCGTESTEENHEDETIAQEVDGIDVILSGHSHREMDEPMLINNTTIAAAGTALHKLGRLDISKDGDHWKVDDYELIPLDERFPPDEKIESEINAERAKIQETYLSYYGYDQPMNAPVAYTPYSYVSGDVMTLTFENFPFADLITDAYMYATEKASVDDVDFSICPVGSIRQGLNEGPLSISDVFNTSAFGYSETDDRSVTPLTTAYLTGKSVYDLCEVSVSISQVMTGAQLYFSGLQMRYDPGRLPFNKVYEVQIFDRESNAYKTINRDDTLYKMVIPRTAANFLPVVKEKSFGLLEVTLLDENKNVMDTSALNDSIVHYTARNGESRELKLWYALYEYLEQFDKTSENLPTIPVQYQEAEGRTKAVTNSFFHIFVNPNRAAHTIYGVSVGAVILIGGGVYIVLRRRRKKKVK